MQAPDSIRVFFSSEIERLDPMRGGLWTGEKATVKTYLYSDRLRLSLECAGDEPMFIAVRWNGNIVGVRRYLALGERSEWRAEDPDRAMPWYFMAYDGKRTHGYGVGAKANGYCHWTADRSGITLWLDVRNGTQGVQLGDRELELCEVISREGDEDESAFQSHSEFCRLMSPHPRLAGQPVYGLTDRYRNEGDQTVEAFLQAAKVVSELSPNETNRPFCLMESPQNEDRQDADLAKQLKEFGTRAGACIHPLRAAGDHPDSWRLAGNSQYLDPTHPDASEYIGLRVADLVEAGFDLVKCALPNLGFSPSGNPETASWSFHNRSRTNAEVMTHLFERIRFAAGSSILACEGVPSHLASGIFEISAIGGEVNASSWEAKIRARANHLAYHGAQQGNFFALDVSAAQVIGSAHDRIMADWVRLLGESGTTMFASVDPNGLGVEEWTMLRDAFGFAALEWPTAEPIDWMNSVCPRKWKLREERVEFDWSTLDGPGPVNR